MSCGLVSGKSFHSSYFLCCVHQGSTQADTPIILLLTDSTVRGAVAGLLQRSCSLLIQMHGVPLAVGIV